MSSNRPWKPQYLERKPLDDIDDLESGRWIEQVVRAKGLGFLLSEYGPEFKTALAKVYDRVCMGADPFDAMRAEGFPLEFASSLPPLLSDFFQVAHAEAKCRKQIDAGDRFPLRWLERYDPLIWAPKLKESADDDVAVERIELDV